MFTLLQFVLKPMILLISYISGNNSFPKPLSAKEEEYYLDLYKNGDMDAKNTLIEHNLRLVAHVAKKYSGSVKDNEDLISIGTIGLMKAINTFNNYKGTKLATYAARCIENEILMVIRTNKKSIGDISLNDSIGTDKEGNQISLIDVLSNDDEEISDRIDFNMQVRDLHNIINDVLDEREKHVIAMRYGLGDYSVKPQRSIAQIMGISRSYVSRIEKKAIKKLRKRLDKK